MRHVSSENVTFPYWFIFVHFRAHNLDPDDSEVLFHLALSQAVMRQVSPS